MNKNSKKRTMLYICAHSDDDVLVGGTMRKLVLSGWNVNEIICTSAKNAMSSKNEKTPQEMKKNRDLEVLKYCKNLGVNPPIILDPSERLFGENADLILQITKLLRKIRPDVVVLMNKEDYHFEHTASHLIGLRAYELACRSTQPELGPKLGPGILLQTDGLNLLPNPIFTFDTSKTHKDKISALKKSYGARVDQYLIDFTNGLGATRGARIGTKYGEVYELLNPTWYKLNSASVEVLSKFVSIGSA